ncbi:MAG TPA: thioredoxin family protein [Verrucomicrobiae bacterium]|jgi:thiol:disulfide interchange protein
MKKALFFSGLLLLLSPLIANHNAAEAPKNAKVLYDVKANGNEQIKTALAKAEKENKNVILKFGANWCGWCHKLSGLFHDNSEIAKILEENYILVLIDVDAGHNSDVVTRYGNPTQHGLPVLVVLDKAGKQLHTQDTGLLEDGNHHDPAKVKAFLEKWKPTKA